MISEGSSENCTSVFPWWLTTSSDSLWDWVYWCPALQWQQNHLTPLPDDTWWVTDNIVASNSHSGSQTPISGRHSNIMQKASWMANGWFGRWADECGAFPKLVPPDPVCLHRSKRWTHPRGNQSCQSAEIGLLRFRVCERKNDSKTSCLSCPCKGVVWISGSD